MDFYNTTTFASSETYNSYTAPKRELLFISVSLLFIVVLKSFLQYIDSKLPFRAVLMASGATIGYVARGNKDFASYLNLSSLDPNLFMLIFLPMYIFNNVFKINQAVFTKNHWQAVVLALAGVLSNAAVVGGLLKVTFFQEWYWTTVLIYGVLCSPSDGQEVINQLFDSPIAQYFQTLLEGESFFGETLSIYLFKFLLYKQIECVNIHESFNLGLQFVVGAMIFGYIIGRITALVVVYTCRPATSNAIIISSLYMTVYIAMYCLNVSADIAVAILSAVLAKRQYRMKNKVRRETAELWNILSFIGISFTIFLASCAVGQYTTHIVEMHDVFKVGITVIIIPFVRSLTVIIVYPILAKMNGGFTIRQAAVTILSFGRSSLSLAMSLLLIQYGTKDGKSHIINVHVFWIVLITLIMVGCVTPHLLKYLRLKEPSLNKRNHLRNCLRRLEKSRDKTISILKMFPQMSDLNWTALENGTSIDHPYNVSMEDYDEAENNDVLAFLDTTCLPCRTSRVSEHHTNEEVLTLMRREAKRRILKAKRISYRKQHHEGLLSLESLTALLHMIDESEFSSNMQLKTDWIENIWKPKSSTMNMRHRLLTVLVQDEPEPLWVEGSCRQISYSIATSHIFKCIIYCAVILNSLLMVTELTTHKYPNPAMTVAFQFGHISFYFLLLWEISIKIAGFSFDGYLNSKWNQLEFMVFVLATLDEFLLLMGYVLMEDIEELLISSSWLRTFRLLRLLKLSKVVAPRIIMTFDSFLNNRMLSAFEIGKGFVTAENEVLDILPYIIDDESICLEMQKEIEQDRNETLKQLISLQKNRPYLATSVRTKHAIRHVLVNMRRSAVDMRNEGLLEKGDYKKLKQVLEEKYHQMQNSFKYLQQSPVKVVLKNVKWLSGDEKSLSYLQHRLRSTYLGPGQTVLHLGQTCPFIHVVLNGTLVSFSDNDDELPIVAGDCLGLVEFLTGRHVNYSVVTLSSVHLCTFPGEHIRSCILSSGPSSNGMESRLWSFAMQDIAIDIIRKRPGLKHRTRQDLYKLFENCFVPILETFKIFQVTDNIEHIILVHGEIMDQSSKVIFKAPSYIPRTIEFLTLPNINEAYSQKLYPKLLIIPAEPADEFVLREKEDGTTHVVGLTNHYCLRHQVLSSLATTRVNSAPIPSRRKTRGFCRNPSAQLDLRNELNFNGNFDPNENITTVEINGESRSITNLSDEGDGSSMRLLFQEK